MISVIVFACAFGGALLGMRVRAMLPQSHLDESSKDVVRAGVAVVATMVALVLGLLIAAAKDFYDTQSSELVHFSANVVLMDRLLAHYGPEAASLRATLKHDMAIVLDDMMTGNAALAPTNPRIGNTEGFYDHLLELAPKDDEERAVKTQLQAIALEIAKTRWLMYEQRASSIPMPLIIALIGWLTLVFLSSGLFATANTTVLASFGASALSVAGAIWLIIQMYSPYTGFIHISTGPLKAALAQLGT